MDSHHNDSHEKKSHHHHILPDRVALAVGATLLVLTAVTVFMGHVNLGRINMLVALGIASVKAALVCLFFMNLRYDRRENGLVFSTSFLFLAIFIVLTGTDLFFRGDVYVKGPLLVTPASAQSKFKTPWVSSPELLDHGKELFAAQCTSCHGANGMGDGLAAAALNPKPRNFHATVGWKNGHKPSQIFKTLKEGLAGSAMASFASLPGEDRWALAHYVASLNPEPLKDGEADLALVGIKGGKMVGAEGPAPSIPVEAAIEILSRGSAKAGS